MSHPDRCVQCGQHKDDRPECIAVQAALDEMTEYAEALAIRVEGAAPPTWLVRLFDAIDFLFAECDRTECSPWGLNERHPPAKAIKALRAICGEVTP